MVELGGDLDFAEEPLGADSRGEFRAQDFDRDVTLVLQVPGEIDDGHAARAQFFLNGIAVGEGGFQAVEKVWHCVSAQLATVLEYGLWS